MKLRQMFYTQIERRTFHTAWCAGTAPDTRNLDDVSEARFRSFDHGDRRAVRPVLGRIGLLGGKAWLRSKAKQPHHGRGEPFSRKAARKITLVNSHLLSETR